MSTSRLALVTGATGHVGGRLVPALLDAGFRVRVLSRHPDSLASAWAERVEAVEGDASEPADLAKSLADVDVAYYLLHSMDGEGDFEERDREMASRFAAAAKKSGVGRMVYLSGLHPVGELSPHLASRVEVGKILLDSGVPTAVLQAGTVIGEGSASFDMLRHLSERLPLVIAPRWLKSKIQPICDDDVIHYLVGAADLPQEVNRAFDIAGPDVLTYADMMRRYASAIGLPKRRIATVPVLTPNLAGHWVGLVTPVSAGVAKPLAGSLVHDAVASENDIDEYVSPPEGGLAGFEESVHRATKDVDTRAWSRSIKTSAAIVGVTALVGSLLTDPNSRWYKSLDLPPWQPPAVAFPVVWSALYAGTTVASAAAIAELPEPQANSFKTALVANMVLNAGWSGVFFRAHRPAAATVVAGALAASSADLARRAGASPGTLRKLTLGSYAAWCTFATALSGEIARRNH